MNPETRICQNCKKEFVIAPEDFEFYGKIGVPVPTFCPWCRMIRRITWRNERTLHNNTCAATGKPIISGFAPDSGYTVYERDYWWTDAWDPMSYGQGYDFNKTFFEQFDELMHRVPHPAVFNSRTVNCSYTQHTGEFKDGYLVSASWDGENIMYSSRCNQSKDSMDTFVIDHCQFCIEDVECAKCAQTFFSQESEACVDSWFLFNCKGCTSCFGCTNLRNKSYYIFNEPYSKDEYQKKLAELDPGSFKNLEVIKQKFEELKQSTFHLYAKLTNSPESTGNMLGNVMNCKECFGIFDDVRDCKYVQNGGFGMTDSYDGYGVGASADFLYEIFDSGVQGSRQLFGGIIYGCMNVTYCYNLTNCENMFGCIGLRKKSYCILNKQYSKEEYEALMPRIRAHMMAEPSVNEQQREWGEFFPTSISPFSYNETIAQDYAPLTKDEALAKGYKWRDKEPSKHVPTIQAENLPDHIKYVNEEILKEIIECVECHRPYRIIARELEFLKQFGIPLPRKCFECRHQDRFRQVNPPRLYHRQCMCTQSHPHHEGACVNEFETPYPPEKPEIIYCEKCYLAEVA